MVKTAILMNEIDNLTEESAAEVLDFVLSLRTRKPTVEPQKSKSMFGVFPGINTDVEREGEGRV